MAGRKKLITILCIILAVLLAIGVYFTVSYLNYLEAERLREEAKNKIDTQAQEEIPLPENPINFKKLQKKNDDIYAWIKIENTKIDYPILQAYSEDDDFYLNHNVEKNYDINGSIYTERQNAKDFSDPNTLIYGHNMLDGSMFQNLHKFRDKKFFDKNRYIYIYMPGHILKYEIFSAYKSDNKHILNCYDFSDEAIYADYLKNAANPKSLEKNTREYSLTTEDRIITLSTCIGNEKAYRYLVQGVLIDDIQTQ